MVPCSARLQRTSVTEPAWLKPWDVYRSVASTRDVVSAGWPSLSFAAWAVGNTGCYPIWRGCTAAPGRVIGMNAWWYSCFRPGMAGVSQGISFSLQDGEHHRCKTCESYMNGIEKVLKSGHKRLSSTPACEVCSWCRSCLPPAIPWTLAVP